MEKRELVAVARELPVKKTYSNEKYENVCLHFGVGRKNERLRFFYKVYLATTIAAVVAVLLLLAFGVGANGRPLISSLSPKNIYNAISCFFANIDFPDLSFGDDNIESKDTAKGNAAVDNKENEETDAETLPSIEAGGVVDDIYRYDMSAVPVGCTPIIPMDLSLSVYGELYINNSTGYAPALKTLLDRELSFRKENEGAYNNGEPLVLIIHTHGTEAYSENDAKYYVDDSDVEYARSDDTSKNVVAVGRCVTEILNQNGISTMHCTVMHDSVQYKDSYARAEETIKRLLERYPSIKIVIDIHRDAIIRSNGEMVRPVCEVNGEAAAQLMCVVGSDYGGDTHKKWQDDLSLALKLRSMLNHEQENLCRPVHLRSATYNQELCEYSLLIEVGAAGNSLQEALNSAAILGDTLSKLINEMK